MTIELPKMPDGKWSVEDFDGFVSGYASDQMTSYGLSCYEAGVRAERERAARVCDALIEQQKQDDLDKESRELKGADAELATLRFWSTVSTYNAGIKKCAAAIRKGE